ncbi:MAG: Transcriptional regulator MraZ [Candidatus Ordinivivax streblomastigis]|uniref:Transcriptional regulator MraZ n=1 Tax=Candidatus Ordinivivax streblomastigis TaxID=2540710 RepID=A0A5M8P1Z9_9BACT|nr:MAG: Transcriptional regulator MraZ [Candidatus Ordinivivax streblomastigis]
MEDYTGNIGAKLDTQGRVPVPVVFRRILQQTGNNTLYIRPDTYRKCLVLYSLPAWEAEKSKWRERLDLLDEEESGFYECMISDTQQVEMDSVGRIQIPKCSLQSAGITGEVRFVGVDNTIKLWNPDHYDEFIRISRENFKANAKRFLSKPKAE